MYIVIYERITKKIVAVLEEKEGMEYSYSDNCTEVHMDEKPEGRFIDL